MEVQTKTFNLGSLGTFDVRLRNYTYGGILRSSNPKFNLIQVSGKFSTDGYQSALKHIGTILNLEVMQLKDKAQVYSDLKDSIDSFIQEN